MPICPYTLLRPVFTASNTVLKHVNSANDHLRPYSNILFGLFSLNMVLSLYSPAFEYGGPDQPVDVEKVGIMRDGSPQYSWFHWKPFLANLNMLHFYMLRNTYGIDWWTDLLALSFVSLDAIDRVIAHCLGNHGWKMTILGGVSLPKFQLLPKEGNPYDAQRLHLVDWKYNLMIGVRRIAVTSFVSSLAWKTYSHFFLHKKN